MLSSTCSMRWQLCDRVYGMIDASPAKHKHYAMTVGWWHEQTHMAQGSVPKHTDVCNMQKHQGCAQINSRIATHTYTAGVCLVHRKPFLRLTCCWLNALGWRMLHAYDMDPYG